jgi:hypothetical protein
MEVICVSGSGRTGSTLLSLLLTQNDDVLNIGQARDFAQAYLRGADCSCGRQVNNCMLWSAVAERAFGTSRRAALSELRDLLKEFRKDANSISDWGDANELARLARDHGVLVGRLAEFLGAAAAETRVDALVDTSKSPEVAFAFSLAEGVKVRLINLVRDPRAVASSWALKEGSDDVGLKYARAWAKRQRALSRWSAALGDRFMHLRYEDFTAAPRATVARILAWAGLRPSPGLFTSDDHAEISWERQHLFPPANEGVLAEKRGSVDVVTASAWCKAENRRLHELVQKEVGADLMRQFAYGEPAYQ